MVYSPTYLPNGLKDPDAIIECDLCEDGLEYWEDERRNGHVVKCSFCDGKVFYTPRQYYKRYGMSLQEHGYQT